jgi:hypothetical protein
MATITTLKAGNWSDPTVWNGGVLPGINDYASTSHGVIIDQNITCLGLRVTANINGFTASGNTTRNITLTATDALAFTTTTQSFINITNTGTTNIITYLTTVPNLIGSFIQCNSSGGIINATILGGWTQDTGQTGNAIFFTTGSLNQTLNITGNILASANTDFAMLIQGTNNTVNFTGDVNSSSSSSTNPTINVGGTNCKLNMTGTFTCDSAPIINTTNTTALITIGGILIGGSTGNNAIISSSTATVRVSGIISQVNNVNPLFVQKLRLTSNLDTTWTFNTDVLNTNKTLYSAPNSIGLPVQGNVRNGVVYGASNEYTGSVIMAVPSNVRNGVPTDNTVGTGDLTAQEFWNTLSSTLTTNGSIGKLLVDNVDTTISSRATNSGVISELNTSNTDVAVRLRNVSTVAITGEQIASQQ